MANKPSLAERVLRFKVNKRRANIEKYVTFVCRILAEIGSEVGERQFDGLFNVHRWLAGIDHFSFYAHFKQTGSGGNIIKIFYHPKTASIDREAYLPDLEVYWDGSSFDVGACWVDWCDDVPWSGALDKVIKSRADRAKELEEIVVQAQRVRAQTPNPEIEPSVESGLPNNALGQVADRLGLVLRE